MGSYPKAYTEAATAFREITGQPCKGYNYQSLRRSIDGGLSLAGVKSAIQQAYEDGGMQGIYDKNFSDLLLDMLRCWWLIERGRTQPEEVKKQGGG